MCLGIALIGSDLPTEMIGRCGLGRLHHMRGTQPEYRFYYRDRLPRLPVIRGGELCLARWGNGRGQSTFLPRTGWTWAESIREGLWQESGACRVDISASYVLDGRGVWTPSPLGVRGLLVPDEHGKAVVFVICEPSSDYYRTMTGSTRMPVFVQQTI